jgi:hypothetical protein
VSDTEDELVHRARVASIQNFVGSVASAARSARIAREASARPGHTEVCDDWPSELVRRLSGPMRARRFGRILWPPIVWPGIGSML